MKRQELIRILEETGCVLVHRGRRICLPIVTDELDPEVMGWMRVRHEGSHDWYANPLTKQLQPIPRHAEINENLAKHIIEKLGSSKKDRWAKWWTSRQGNK